MSAVSSTLLSLYSGGSSVDGSTGRLFSSFFCWLPGGGSFFQVNTVYHNNVLVF